MKNYLKGLISTNGLNINQVSEILKISRITMSKKIKGISEFTQSEIKRLIEILEIPDNEIKKYFFD